MYLLFCRKTHLLQIKKMSFLSNKEIVSLDWDQSRHMIHIDHSMAEKSEKIQSIPHGLILYDPATILIEIKKFVARRSRHPTADWMASYETPSRRLRRAQRIQQRVDLSRISQSYQIPETGTRKRRSIRFFAPRRFFMLNFVLRRDATRGFARGGLEKLLTGSFLFMAVQFRKRKLRKPNGYLKIMRRLPFIFRV